MRAATHILEVTSVCNLRCPYCIVNHGMKRPHRHMSLEQLIRLANEIVEFGPNQEVYLFNYGEPMLHPEIHCIVAAMTARGIRTKISTNGTNLVRMGPAVLKAGLSVLLIDLDGVTQEAHATYRVGSEVAALIDEIRQFMADPITASTSTQIILQTIVHRQNVNQHEDLRTFARSVGIRRIAWKALGLDLGAPLGQEEFRATKERLIPVGTPFDRYAGLLRDSNERCLFAEMNGVVLSNGDYTICTHDADSSVVLGNVFIDGYRKLRATAFAAVREQIATKKLPPCAGCSMSSNLGYVEDLTTRRLPGTINFSSNGILVGE